MCKLSHIGRLLLLPVGLGKKKVERLLCPRAPPPLIITVSLRKQTPPHREDQVPLASLTGLTLFHRNRSTQFIHYASYATEINRSVEREQMGGCQGPGREGSVK